jgi:phage-related protein
MVNATYFTYDGISSAAYGLQIAAFSGSDSDSVEENESFSPSLTTVKAPSLLRFYHGGVIYESAPECEFTVVSSSIITPGNRAAIFRWLVGRNEFKPLVFLESDLSAFTYYCVFTSVSTIYVNGVCHGFKLTATFDSPFARGKPTVATTQSGTNAVQVINNSDIMDGYTYPTVSFVGSSISIVNTTDDTGREFAFSGLGDSEQTTVDCEAKTIRSNLGGEKLSNFTSKKWLRLRRGINNLIVTATGDVTITCPYYAMIGY